jgi:hypothetical protein
LTTIHKPNRNIMKPCPRSPNITENRNGKEIMVNGAETRKTIHLIMIKKNK